jgi:hypothetical protein
MILNKFDPLLNQYREAVASLGSEVPPLQLLQMRLRVAIVNQMTWLTYIIGAIVSGHSWSSAPLTNVRDGVEPQSTECYTVCGMDYRLLVRIWYGSRPMQSWSGLAFLFPELSPAHVHVGSNGEAPTQEDRRGLSVVE